MRWICALSMVLLSFRSHFNGYTIRIKNVLIRTSLEIEGAQAVTGLVNWLQDDLNRTDIAVLTFYSAQQSLLATVFNERQLPKNVNISTVDAFEGREAECVISSL
jgi:hypothetical protein